MKIRIYKGKDGDWHIKISGKNNRIYADMAGYNTRKIALASIKAVLKYAACGNYTIK